ncbi:MAG: TetR/AcrR family transcriptional regulator [Planctomycetota bacterium]|jgi:TetR/AcrR family fatty acid metabolism transcriptional regulator
MGRRPGKAERRRRILESARQVFARRGFAATRMSDIATEAKVGKGTLYEYFRGKEELFSTLVVGVARESLESLRLRGLSDDPAEALRDVIAYVVEIALGENLDLYRLFFDFWGIAAAHRGEAQQHLRDVQARFGGFVGELVRRGQREGAFRPEVDPARFASALSAAVDGLSLRIVILGERVDLRAYAACLQDLLLSGLATEGSLGGASLIRERKK